MKEDARAVPPAAGMTFKAMALRLVALVGLVGLGALGYWGFHRFVAAVPPEEHFRRGQEAVNVKNWDAVRREAIALEGSAGFEAHSHLLFGHLNLSKGRMGEALDELTRAYDHPDTRVDALVTSGDILYGLNQLSQAENVLQNAREFDPDNLRACKLLALVYYDLGATDLSAQYLGHIALIDPTDPSPHRMLGLINLDFERYTQAVDNFKDSLRLGPNQPDVEEVRFDLATSLVRVNRFEEALEALKECRDTLSVLALRSEALHRAGRPEESLHLAESVLIQDPNNLDALVLKGTILLEMGKSPEAVEILQRSVNLYPKDYASHFKLSQALVRVGQTERGAELLKYSEELRLKRKEFTLLHYDAMKDPYDAEIRVRLGVLASELGMIEAEDWFRAALALKPDHEEAIRGLNKWMESRKKAAELPPDVTPSAPPPAESRPPVVGPQPAAGL
jgi:tetratricopeptide (TPR) repeat protein